MASDAGADELNIFAGRVAVQRPCSQRFDDILIDSGLSDLPVESCHNSIGRDIRSVDDGSSCLPVDRKVGTTEGHAHTPG
jgi:hypothetical protein